MKKTGKPRELNWRRETGKFRLEGYSIEAAKQKIKNVTDDDDDGDDGDDDDSDGV